MTLIQWNEEMSVNNEEIDAQHKKLIFILNNLQIAVAERQNREVLSKIIEALVDYTQYHFSTEEKYFHLLEPKLAEKHKKEHDNFVEKIKDFQEGYQNKRMLLSLDILEFLRDWLINHILGTDKKCAPLFGKKEE